MRHSLQNSTIFVLMLLQGDILPFSKISAWSKVVIDSEKSTAPTKKSQQIASPFPLCASLKLVKKQYFYISRKNVSSSNSTVYNFLPPYVNLNKLLSPAKNLSIRNSNDSVTSQSAPRTSHPQNCSFQQHHATKNTPEVSNVPSQQDENRFKDAKIPRQPRTYKGLKSRTCNATAPPIIPRSLSHCHAEYLGNKLSDDQTSERSSRELQAGFLPMTGRKRPGPDSQPFAASTRRETPLPSLRKRKRTACEPTPPRDDRADAAAPPLTGGFAERAAVADARWATAFDTDP